MIIGTRHLLAAVCLTLPVLPAAAHGQDSLRLGALHAAAIRHDPRGAQLDLLAAQSALRVRNVDAEKYPWLTVLGQAQYQSDVVTIPIVLPGGAEPPSPPNDTYDAHLAARQRLYDATRGARREVEQATLAAGQARVRSSLHRVRADVNEAYFTSLLLDAQAAELSAAIVALESQLVVAVQRVEAGAALPGDAAALEAELLRRRQSLDELATGAVAARRVLADLTGRAIGGGDALSVPDLSAEVAQVRASLDAVRARPELDEFARTRELIGVQAHAIAARTRPRVSAYGRAGYGRPGLDLMANEFDTYWLAGVQVEWTPWTWGASAREREALLLQQQISATEEAAFIDGVRRSVTAELAAIDRLVRTLESDEAILELRAGILRETRERFTEGVITSAEYVDRESDVLEARLARLTHGMELARAHARFLTLLGIEIR